MPVIAAIPLFIVALVVCGGVYAASLSEQIRGALSTASGQPLRIEGAFIEAREAIHRFYSDRGYKPAWLTSAKSTHITQLLEAIADADTHGLNPQDYHLDALREAFGARKDIALEILATDAFFRLGAHLLGGKLNPTSLEPDWTAMRRERDLVAVLDRALATGSIKSALTVLEPNAPSYRVLKSHLASYRARHEGGGWQPIPQGPSLKLGDSGPRVAALRRRLHAGELLSAHPPERMDEFDIEVETAVARFQRRIGIEPDGVVGPVTLKNLNVSAEQRIQQIRANLERWRWLSEDLGERHIRVNIADFSLEARNQRKVERVHNVIVGRVYRKTPVFSDAIRYVVLNPWWDTPPRLARQDKLPAFQANPESVKALGFVVLDKSGEPVDPDSIRWTDYSAATFPYRLRQRPGPENALGQVKIMFPNKHNVYLHDTPTRDLFAKPDRALSSGCVRVGDVISLTEWILQETPGWPRDRIDAGIATGKERRVNLESPLPVHILYMTAVVGADESIRFVNDVYDRDARLIAALAAPASQ